MAYTTLNKMVTVFINNIIMVLGRFGWSGEDSY